jgi:FkbM family methyltransferase
MNPLPGAPHDGERLQLGWAAVIFSLSLLLLVESRFGGWDAQPLWGDAAAGPPGAPPRPHRAPRDPQQVFIDVGTNNGLSVLRFLGVAGVGAPFDASTPKREGHWHVAMVEANPYHTERLEAMARDVESFGHSAQLLMPLALSTEDGGNITFFLDSWQSGTYAATTVESSRSISGEKISVPTVDLAHLCGEIVFGGLREDDYVVVKIDVEGAEYDILLQAIESGVPALWDELYVEFHEDNDWVLRGTALEHVSREKHARIVAEMQSRFSLRVGDWDRR